MFLGRSSKFAGIFYVSSHGRKFSYFKCSYKLCTLINPSYAAMFNLANNATSYALICEFYKSNKVILAVCYSPAALVNVKLSNRSYLVDS